MFPETQNITSLNPNFTAFPDAKTIFSTEQAWLAKHFLPLLSIDLAVFNPEWAGIVVHMLNPIEPYECYIGDETGEYHNEFTCRNWLAFRLSDDNRYIFLGQEGYFQNTPFHQPDEDLLAQEAEMRQDHQQAKDFFQKHGKLPNNEAFLHVLGGKFEYSNWSTEDPPPAFHMDIADDGLNITYQGKPFIQVAAVAGYNWGATGADAIILMYEPESRTVLFTFDWT
ncbi:hypothetical protein [Conchiformibius kuhniae]|uniref:DUF1963 domain-containing protein n=1 Tax=Conchiformibius kuhniae TaxID=211502 RepID=A0A8T9MT62_9NEIS|nr:hypothetical protein [Conchiformibius kuhniae]UOP04797.1 hypothetical protein LVJ77_11730 [Conchiformibius kuhniae]